MHGIPKRMRRADSKIILNFIDLRASVMYMLDMPMQPERMGP